MTKAEVVQWFEREWSGKVGVARKVEEVLKRRTKLVDGETLKWVGK